MNKGRNILLLLACLLCISILTFFSIFQQGNKQGVVDNVRYVREANDDETITYSFYFVKDPPVKATVTEDAENWFVNVENYAYSYSVAKGTGVAAAFKDGKQVTDGSGFSLYTKDLFKSMFIKSEPMLKAWQAVLIAITVFAGGAVILFAEELWHIVFKKGKDEIPQWKDMNGIKYVGGGVIAVGILLFIIFIFI